MNQNYQKKKPEHLTSVPGENKVGSRRFCLLCDAANKAANAFKQEYYLEAITLTESLLATRLESRLAWVRKKSGMSKPVQFSNLGNLCNELKNAASTEGFDPFQRPIDDIRQWCSKRNAALHEMAKLNEMDDRSFQDKYYSTRSTALEGFTVLLDYDAVDRNERRKAGLFTASDDKNNGTAFDNLERIVHPS